MAPCDAVVASCEAVSRRFTVRGDDVLALADLDLTVGAGTLTVIAGPSGSGKSTLLSILGCLDRPTTGSVRLLGEEVHELGRRQRRVLRRTTVASLLPQPADNLLFGLSGRANIRLAARHRGASSDRVDQVIDSLAIGDFIDRLADTMSGGEQQRVALACVLAGGCPIVLADEPTGALDRISADDVVGALRAAADAGATVVAAAHDPAVIEAATTVVWLDHGRRAS